MFDFFQFDHHGCRTFANRMFLTTDVFGEITHQNKRHVIIYISVYQTFFLPGKLGNENYLRCILNKNPPKIYILTV